MRVIIRFSLNSDTGSVLRNQLAPILQDKGLVRISTGTWEGNVAENDVRAALRDFWKLLANYTGKAHLDHFWMYADNPTVLPDYL